VSLTETQHKRIMTSIFQVGLLSLICAVGVGCTAKADQDLLPLKVVVASKSMSKLPFVIAEEQGLYEKYGLDVELDLQSHDADAEVETQVSLWKRTWLRIGRRVGIIVPPRPTDIHVDGHTPTFVRQARGIDMTRWVALAATDCSLRYYVISRPGISQLDQLKGKRLGIGNDISTSGFTGLRLVQQLGWERGRDISIVRRAGIDELRHGLVDAIIGGDDAVEAAEKEGFRVLEDTRKRPGQLSGNSAMVAPDWLDQGTNREAARRFLTALAEAVAIFHHQPDVVLEVMAKRYGAVDRAVAEKRYRRADYVPQKPYPCREGIVSVMEYFHLDEMREYTPETFYDDSLMVELDETGFIDALYE
jgi:NitT/TauT family transport system substrate-binding protein